MSELRHPQWQVFQRTVMAEIRKYFRVGGIRKGLIIVALAAVLNAFVLLVVPLFYAPLIEVLAPSLISLAQTPKELPFYIFVLIIAVVVPREISQGEMLLSKTLLPRMNTLYFAKLLAWSLIVFGTTLLIGTLTIGFGMVTPFVAKEHFALAFLQLLVSALGSTVLCVLMYEATIILKQGAYVIGAFFLVNFLVPTGMLYASLYLPENLRTVVSKVEYVLPAKLFGIATTLPGTQSIDPEMVKELGLGLASWQGVALGWLGLGAWVAAIGWWGFRSFSKSSFSAAG